MPRDCHLNAYTRCIECPEIPPTPGTSAQVIVTNITGWNAGSDSELEFDGDLHTVFSVKVPALGVMVGFRPVVRTPLSIVTYPERLTHAIYCTTIGGNGFFSIRENGAQIGSNHVWGAESDVFEIRRVNAMVSYFKNGELIHQSERASHGALLVTSCLYGSGDAVL